MICNGNHGDHITGLMSMGDYIAECARIFAIGDRKLVFVTNDISNFKYVNNLYSMEEGDRFIEEMAHYFYIDNPRCLAACRMGCDQFKGLIDITGVTEEEEVERITNMNCEFERRMSEKYPNIYFHMYTGAYFPDGSERDVHVCIDRAHLAKKVCKGRFDINCSVYNPEDFKIQTNQMEISNIFIRACENDGILVYLQPKYSVSEGSVVGAEALVRVEDGKGGILPPAAFVPVLEATGMVGKLDQIMLEKVFKLQRKWIDAGYKPCPISVNLSRVGLVKSGFVDMVLELQKKYDVPSSLIEVEVLESTVIDAVEAIVYTINRLREEGFKVSVDDFGSGYSSLNQIASIPADIIKIDRVFANPGLSTERGRNVVKALIRMLNDIDYKVVFEGIETENEKDLVYSYGCDVIQGYYYSKPMPVDDFEQKYMK